MELIIEPPCLPRSELEGGLIQTAGLPAGARVILSALARITSAIFTLTIRITALG